MTASTSLAFPPNGAQSWREPVSTATALPVTGQLGEGRIAQDTGLIYGWDGTAWVTPSGGGGSGIASINADTTSAQTIVPASTGTDFTVATASGVTTLAIPSASGTARGLVSTLAQTFAGAKTFLASIFLFNGSVTTPSTGFANSTTTGWYSAAAGVINAAFAGATPTEFGASYIAVGKATAGSPPGTGLLLYENGSTTNLWGLGGGSTSYAGNTRFFGIANNGFGTVFGINCSNTGMMLFNAAGVSAAPLFQYDFISRSTLTIPTWIGVQNTYANQPVLTVRNQGTATNGNFGGLMNCGDSTVGNGGIFFFNDVNDGTAAHDQSHCEIWTATAGTKASNVKFLNTGQLALQLAGGGLSVKEGSNCKQGGGTLVAGTVAVANTSVTSTSRIQITVSTPGGTQGFLSYTKTAGTGFTVTSTSVLETSAFDYFITEQS